jgi:hypothetical protein
VTDLVAGWTQLFLLHTFFDNVKRAQVDEIRRQHAEACAKQLLEEEDQKKKQTKKPYAQSTTHLSDHVRHV